MTNDADASGFYNRNMATRPRNDWYLREWLLALSASQADLERLTGWDKRKASHLVNGKQPYKRDTVNEAADALNVAPFELLMHPDDAFALRRQRESAIKLAAEKRSPFRHAPEEPGIRKAG
jgi:transcriptional regulator with XRE-family HTH domain